MMGVFGACWVYELTNVTIDHVKDYGTEIIVKFADSKAKATKQFMISGAFAEIVKKYMKLRPLRTETMTDRFFINYRGGKCTTKVIGEHTIAEFPKKIAEFLELPDAEGYTENCFRKSSSTILAEIGVGSTMHGVGTSTSVAAGKIVIKYELSTELTCHFTGSSANYISLNDAVHSEDKIKKEDWNLDMCVDEMDVSDTLGNDADGGAFEI